MKVHYFDAEEGERFSNEELFDDDVEGSEDDSGSSTDEEASSTLLPAVKSGLVVSAFQSIFSNSVHAPEAGLADELQRRAAAGGRVSDLHQPERMRKKDSLLGDAAVRSEARQLPGVFEKRSPWWVEGWRPRHFVLSEMKLLYYDASRPDRPLGVLDFGLLNFEIHCAWLESDTKKVDNYRQCDHCTAGQPIDWRTFYIKPRAFPSKAFAFRGPKEDVKTLLRMISGMTSSPQHSLSEHERAVVSKRNFWRYPFIRESIFLQSAESGDILLFQGKERRSALTRAVTASSWDHIALLLRSLEGEMLILEALGNAGVSFVTWEEFKERGWHKCYTHLAFRKVYFKRSKERLKKLQDFVGSVLGESYSLSLSKIFVRRYSREFDGEGADISTSLGDSQKGEEDGHRTFFCSELVAACLKRCGVLAGSRSSSQYWPGTFSQHNLAPLPLHAGVHIGEEQ
eukprot:CAMPEP_0170574462 /NCGR_PEP_ID=MMETSP0224-20130122/3310_1 /TAXON_ID=285029 /ORGANISM="Togula jolla, Strain CCCM 725" /LENGTH=454 /DNA_ID=CAMNT_0010897115 /DNA_START=24 /DNA_END=1385 /DNA_ORIENTATION=+